MDNKNTKVLQSSAKGAPTDSKKNQDVTNNRQFPKTSRRCESGGASNSFKHEQPRKYNVQRTKSFDKRPKPKGQYHGCPKEDTKVGTKEQAAFGSVMVPGSKKQNLNHLLNFHYEPRDVQGGSGMWNHGKSIKGYNRNSNRWLPPIQRHKYNKEQFLQASCQFVVSANGNYSLHLTDPDVLVDWKLVEQIKIHSSDSLSCPICLCAPVAGKMTRCGHVYCWPCILHYLSLSDKSWRKCPICYESIQKSELRSVVEVPQSMLNSGDTITLHLMRREKGSLLAVPVGSTMQSPTNFFCASQDVGQQVYSKLLLAKPQDVMSIIECERTQLEVELSDNTGSPESCYIEQALNELSIREEELLLKNHHSLKPDVNTEVVSEITIDKEDNVDNIQGPEHGDYKEDTNLSYEQIFANDEDLKTSENSPVNAQSASGVQKFFYFYQADDGQHLYLHAMNVKMLEMQYGSLENSPHVISGKLLEKEGGSVTEELRRRLRYLCHLPLTCQFEIAEIELKPPIVSEEIVASFHDQLALRQKRRERREREERKREKKITEEENKQMGKYPTPEVHIDSQVHFPEWQPELLFAEENASSPPESAGPSSIASSPSLSTFEEIVSEKQVETPQKQGPSFAEMLRNTGARIKSTNPWPSLAHSKSQARATDRSVPSDADTESYMSMPSYSQSFGDALAHALEQSRLLDGEARKSKGNGNGKKKRNRKKSTALFTTATVNLP